MLQYVGIEMDFIILTAEFVQTCLGLQFEAELKEQYGLVL